MRTAAIETEQQNPFLLSAPADVASLCASELLQRKHYDSITDDYDIHYSDPCSREYRRRFIYEPMFAGIDLSRLKVLDAMCGSGQTTEYLLTQGARVTGLDISTQETRKYKSRWPECHVRCGSMLDSKLQNDSFDCVAIVGGLHHIHPHLNLAIREVHRVLKRGGYFCFMEPHTGSLPDLIRRVWYKHDRLFSDNEAAIDLGAVRREFARDFDFNYTWYGGNVAFLLVLNSLIFRIPARAKPLYSPALMIGEAFINKFQSKLTSCFALARWQKK
jgi:SAM-dependent methyltransferase